MTASCMMVSITNTATGATGTTAPDPVARAEAAFQSGAVRAGMDILDPYWRVLPADPARQAALADLFARYPSARIMALADLRRAAEGFADKAAALAAARQVARAAALGLGGPTPGAPGGPAPATRSTLDELQRTIATRAAEQNRRGTVAWMLTDPYTEVPGLTTPEAETIILDRTLAHARTTPSAETSNAIAAHLGRHPNDAAKIERVRSLMPQLVPTGNGQPVAFQILSPEGNTITVVVQTLSTSPGSAPSVSVSSGHRERESREDLEDRLERQQREFMTRMQQEEEARRRAAERHRRDVEDHNRRQEGLERARRYAEEARQRTEEMNRSYEKQQAEIRRARDEAERRLREERLEREIRLLKEERDAAERRRKP
ncbi:hypothetical protein [Azospirillum oleiclasticum]|uniref:Uncharacterized protein n=1 Tax=Azospirillum oleiclasticum TaxID=2735135 RepID=A0ABX2TDE1_9PROT|nr:hypothetical protein [Azospirillum oleiclasticum]NYZ22288.1 hypothetical protein [Azospirillum oleiclasticum]